MIVILNVLIEYVHYNLFYFIIGVVNMVARFCVNCKNVEKVNTYFEKIDGELCPMDVFVGYCSVICDYVRATDCCGAFENFIY